jgi:hypothetical protein
MERRLLYTPAGHWAVVEVVKTGKAGKGLVFDWARCE